MPIASPLAAPVRQTGQLERFAQARTIAFHTLGCRVNTSDTQQLELSAQERGLTVVPFNERADVYVVNTCTVTAQADQQCRKLSRQARARNPEAIVVAVGCYVQAQPEAARALTALDLALDNLSKASLFDHLDAAQPLRAASDRIALPVLHEGPAAEVLPGERHFIPHSLSRRRAFLKVQDGCSESCSYCIIPRSRGPSRSRPLGEVLAEVERLLAAGYQELVVVGVHLSEWGQDLPGAGDLAQLIRRLCEFDALPSLRVSSLEPEGVSDELVAALCHPKVCPHLHLPVQSGSPRILQAMRRAYRPDDVEAAVARVAAKLPDFGLGSDFIVGFPGETEADFAETVALIERLPFSYLHPFPYSPRPDTDAAIYPAQVPEAERSRRVRELNQLGRRKRAAFIASRLGRSYRTWFLPGPAGQPGMLRGLTGNFLTAHVPGPPELVNCFAQVRLTEMRGGKLMGELAPA